MPSLNVSYLLGHVGKDPEIRSTNSGKKVMMFSIATEISWKKGEEWQRETTWHRILQWEPSDYLQNTVTRGALVLVQGRISNREYKDQNGANKFTSEVVAEKLTPIIAKSPPQQRESVAKIEKQDDYNKPDDDLPF